MENNKQGNQGRFLIAAILSMAVLFGWQYFFAPKPVVNNDANTATQANTAANTSTTTSAPTPQAAQPEPAALTPDTTPNRSITIKSPLYEVTLDSRGAVATSWIILKNESPKADFPVYADGSNHESQKPLQLIGHEALSRNPRELPFRLATDDQAINALVNERNYRISATEESITLADGQEKQIDFTLTDVSGVEVKKTFVFRADSCVSDLAVNLKKGGQSVPNTRLLIGASIGDQAISHHNFYHIESEAVAYSDNSIYRHPGTSFTFDGSGNSSTQVPGSISWAGIGDAYFAMVAVPAQPATGLEYHASKFEQTTEPYFSGIIDWVRRKESISETRHLITAYLPVSTDGSTTKIYTGTKDYFGLRAYSDSLTETMNRPVDMVEIINFSNWTFFRPIFKRLAIPILYALNFINGITHNYGVAIIIFTFLFYMLLFPLRWSQSKSFKKASGNAPKMKEIQDRIKAMQKKGVPNDDPKMRAAQMEQLKMTKDALPIGGCLPMLLQFPLLIAFYTAITVALDIRQASFLWLPDLSAADPWHLLEFAFAISMILSMKFTPQAAAVTPEQQMQQKMMTWLMPAMMLWVMWAAPSGLLLYWFFGNIVSFGQQMVINRLNKPNTPPGTEIVDTVPKGAKQVKPKLA